MTHRVLVHWTAAKVRGRKALPATRRYVGLSRFQEDGDRWPDGAWSIELLFNQPPPEQAGSISAGQARFLFDNAPQDRLFAGARFAVYEGPHHVADVQVLD